MELDHFMGWADTEWGTILRTAPTPSSQRPMASRQRPGSGLLLLVRELRQHWMADAACRGRGAEVFYPDRSMSHAPAKAICAECPVRPQCLEYTMERNEKHGIWAGLNERERRRLRKQRGKAA